MNVRFLKILAMLALVNSVFFFLLALPSMRQLFLAIEEKDRQTLMGECVLIIFKWVLSIILFKLFERLSYIDTKWDMLPQKNSNMKQKKIACILFSIGTILWIGFIGVGIIFGPDDWQDFCTIGIGVASVLFAINYKLMKMYRDAKFAEEMTEILEEGKKKGFQNADN